mmetsp:Transcript_35465/g.87153  ORF Transcript_35465/g.87153 Transcript_35465/m.87153 type:complete len:243 (-) Transcript_35465:660-1388(-)
MADAMQINPDKELKFRFELKKQIPTTIRLTNTGGEEMAFKVKTTAPKKYCVKPNTGLVAAGQSMVVHVIMQAQREWPTDMSSCKDKFLVQSTLSGGVADFTELFAKGKEDGVIKEAKLRVSYVQPAPPPSPVAEDEEEKGGEDGEGPSLSRMYTSKPEFEAAKVEAKAARGVMPEDTATLQRELERMRNKNDSLATDLNMALGANRADMANAARGFSFLHLLITAILAFLAGLAFAKMKQTN